MKRVHFKDANVIELRGNKKQRAITRERIREELPEGRLTRNCYYVGTMDLELEDRVKQLHRDYNKKKVPTPTPMKDLPYKLSYCVYSSEMYAQSSLMMSIALDGYAPSTVYCGLYRVSFPKHMSDLPPECWREIFSHVHDLDIRYLFKSCEGYALMNLFMQLMGFPPLVKKKYCDRSRCHHSSLLAYDYQPLITYASVQMHM